MLCASWRKTPAASPYFVSGHRFSDEAPRESRPRGAAELSAAQRGVKWNQDSSPEGTTQIFQETQRSASSASAVATIAAVSARRIVSPSEAATHPDS